MKHTEFAEMALLTDLQERGKISANEERRLGELQHKMRSEEVRRSYRPNNERERTPQDERFARYLRNGDTTGLEMRTTIDGQATTGGNGGDATAGGYMVPEGFWENLQIAMKAYGGVANDYKLVETDTGNPMPWPTTDPTTKVASILSTELTQLDTPDSYVFGQGMLNAWTYATEPILASVQIIADSAFDVDNFVMERIAEQIGRAKAAKAVSGSGSNEPLGLITALAARGEVSTSGGWVGLSAATPVNVFGAYGDDATTELAGKVLSPSSVLAMVKSVDPAYLPGCRFYFDSEMAWNQRAVVDDSGRPILNLDDGYADGAIGSMFGFPVVVDNSMTGLTTSTVTGPVFGNMSVAMVERRVRGASVMRLDQRWADYLAVGYIGYQRSDYRANDLRAAVCVKANSS